MGWSGAGGEGEFIENDVEVFVVCRVAVLGSRGGDMRRFLLLLSDMLLPLFDLDPSPPSLLPTCACLDACVVEHLYTIIPNAAITSKYLMAFAKLAAPLGRSCLSAQPSRYAATSPRLRKEQTG